MTLALELLLCFLFIRELLECMTRGPKDYFKSLENIFQLCIYFLTFGFIITAPLNTLLANHFAAWAVFFACMNLTQLFGRFDFFGKIIFMAFSVSREIIKTMLVFIPSMLAFVYGFRIMYRASESESFDGFSHTLVKLFVMMLGEFDYDDNISHQHVREEGGRNISIQVRPKIFQIILLQKY